MFIFKIIVCSKCRKFNLNNLWEYQFWKLLIWALYSTSGTFKSVHIQEHETFWRIVPILSVRKFQISEIELLLLGTQDKSTQNKLIYLQIRK